MEWTWGRHGRISAAILAFAAALAVSRWLGDFRADMEQAKVDVGAKTIRSAVPVAVTLQNGHIDANGMEISDDGKRILFFNRVKLMLRGTGASQETTPP